MFSNLYKLYLACVHDVTGYELQTRDTDRLLFITTCIHNLLLNLKVVYYSFHFRIDQQHVHGIHRPRPWSLTNII